MPLWKVVCTAATLQRTMRWLVILTDQWSPIHFTAGAVHLRLTEIFVQSMDSKTWEGSRCRHNDDLSKWAKKVTRNSPESCEAINAKFSHVSQPIPLIKVLENIPTLSDILYWEKSRPKAKAKDTVSSLPKTGKRHLTLRPATHLPRSNHRLLWAAIMHTSHWQQRLATVVSTTLHPTRHNFTRDK